MDYINIGNIVSTHGLDGYVNINFKPSLKKHIKVDTFLFIEVLKGSYIPYCIDKILTTLEDQAIIHFSRFPSVNEAKFIIGKKIMIEDSKVAAKDKISESAYLSSFQIEDVKYGILGQIKEVVESVGQMLAFIDYKGEEIIIPINENMIVDIDEVNQIIKMELPDGLIDIYIK